MAAQLTRQYRLSYQPGLAGLFGALPGTPFLICRPSARVTKGRFKQLLIGKERENRNKGKAVKKQ